MGNLSNLFIATVGIAVYCLPTSGKDLSVAHRKNVDVILARLLSWQDSDTQRDERPFVTAAFAQTIDGKLAAMEGTKGTTTTTSNYPISCPESQLLTHALRSIHDGILVGGRTLEIDNPQLTNRLFLKNPNSPVPIVLDTYLDHIQKLGATCRAACEKKLLVCCDENSANSLESLPEAVLLVPCKCLVNGQLDLRDVLHKLARHHGIRTLMVEGGPSLLSSFFERNLVDAVCITISPKFLSKGVAPVYGQEIVNLCASDEARPEFLVLGSDCILLSKWIS
jgi:2,5-diamino-6-(ribosylamino)-4(3H)-pyrimidinone 5'-phosphate reductase